MQDYRKLVVWQKAHQLVLDVYADSATYLRHRDAWAIRDQMRSAAISIASNIAEGTGRGATLISATSSTIPWVPRTNLSMICFLPGTWSWCPCRSSASGPSRSRQSGVCCAV